MALEDLDTTRKDPMDKIKEKEDRSIDDQALKEKTDECEKLSRDIAVLKNEMQSIMMKLTKQIEAVRRKMKS